MKTWVFIYALLFAMNLAFWFTVGTAFSLFVAGAVLGVLWCHLVEWHFDRKLNREIMEEIDALTRNYDCQMSLFETKENK